VKEFFSVGLQIFRRCNCQISYRSVKFGSNLTIFFSAKLQPISAENMW